MSSTLLDQSEAEPEIPMDDEPEIPLDEPEIPMDPEPGTPNPEPAAYVDPGRAVPLGLVQVLPANFPLPALIRFVADERLRSAADKAAAYALTIDVRGVEGLQTADAAATVVRETIKAIEAHFKEPADLAHTLHQSITGKRAEWIKEPKAVVDTVGRRIYVERQRLQVLADEQRRKDQEEANRLAREEARKRAEDAAKNQAPPAVVENLRQQAETAQAAPVAPSAAAPPKLAGSSTVKNWTCTIKGTPREAEEQQPSMADLTEVQIVKVKELMQDVIAGKESILAFEMGWPYLSKRAKADEGTLSIRNIEAYDAGGTRAKPSRRK